MIVPRSVNNEIFIGDYFKLRIQVLQLVTDVVSLLGFFIGDNCKHNCRTKMDAASSDRTFSPPTKFSMSRLTYRDNFLQFFFC